MFDIVIVEDEKLERKALRKILEEKQPGVRVVGEARNGAEAVELIETVHIDLMLVDIRIPRPNGLEIIQILRDKGLATKIIILTAYDHFDIMKEAIQLKADNFLLKPIRTEELLSAMTDCLRDIPSGAANPGSASSAADPQERGISEQVLELVEANRYRDCLAFAREQVREVFLQEGGPLRHRLRVLLDALTDCLQARGVALAPEQAQGLRSLQAQNLDIRNHFHVQELAFQIVDLLFEESGQGGVHGPSHVQDALNYIERNLHKRVSLEDAADFAHISPSYLSRLFHKEMDTTFICYIKDLRMERARDLLAGSNLPIGNVALDLSFSDTNYFCKAFRKEVGLSPSEYRRQHQQKQ